MTFRRMKVVLNIMVITWNPEFSDMLYVHALDHNYQKQGYLRIFENVPVVNVPVKIPQKMVVPELCMQMLSLIRL